MRRGTYRLGLQMYELGVTVFPNLDLHEAALPVLASLREATGESVQMGVLDQLDVVYVERLEGPRTVRIFHRAGHRLPAHATSTGKVLLAHLPAEVLRPAGRLAARRASPRTPSPTSACCSTSCGRVAERGWAQNVEESALGAVSVAAPVRDDTGAVIAAISVVGPISRARQTLPRHRAAVIGAAALISTPDRLPVGAGPVDRTAAVRSARGIGSAERNCPLYPPGAAGTIRGR